MKTLWAVALLALLPACAVEDTLRLQVPVSETSQQPSRIVVVYERGSKGWEQSQLTAIPSTPVPAAVVIPTPAKPAKDGCGVYVLPTFGATPPIPKLPERGKTEEADQMADKLVSGHIAELRQYIIGYKRQLKQSHDDYLKNCNKEM